MGTTQNVLEEKWGLKPLKQIFSYQFLKSNFQKKEHYGTQKILVSVIFENSLKLRDSFKVHSSNTHRKRYSFGVLLPIRPTMYFIFNLSETSFIQKDIKIQFNPILKFNKNMRRKLRIINNMGFVPWILLKGLSMLYFNIEYFHFNLKSKKTRGVFILHI